jgi:putative membrane protein
MTTPRIGAIIERARTKRPVTWLTIIGVVLLPVVIGGILVAALYNPVERLDGLQAAIVNEDEPVTIGDQLVPLGRQLTAGLVEGSDDLDSNLTWTISNADDAAEGLADGTYAAVVTIPANFSAAATSTQPGETPERAVIDVQTPPDSLVVDDAITAQVTSAAASLMGQEISTLYLENVFLGFTTLGSQLGEAASGAGELADGAVALGDGAAQLGAGLDTISGGTAAAASGATELASGLDTAADAVNDQRLVGAAQQSAAFAADAAADTVATATSIGAVAQSAGALAQTLGGLAAQCAAVSSDPVFCTQLQAAAASAGTTAQSAGAAAQQAATAATSAGTASAYASPTATGIAQLTAQTSAGLTDAAAQSRTLAAGIQQLAEGTAASAEGARELQSGAVQLGDGTAELASGLDSAVAQLPAYTDSEAASLAEVVADPVQAEGLGTSLFGASAIPLLATLALWFGGLGTFVALQAVSRRTLASRAPSVLLALRGLWPGAVLGAVQGLLVAGVVQLAASYDGATWSVFAAVSVLAGVAFAAVNQALVAVFGGAGRWISALVGVLAVATGVVSTVPGVLSGVASIMPTSPAYHGMVAALTSATGVGAGIGGLLLWTLVAFGATAIAVVRRRTITTRALLAASPA